MDTITITEAPLRRAPDRALGTGRYMHLVLVDWEYDRERYVLSHDDPAAIASDLREQVATIRDEAFVIMGVKRA